MHQKGDWPNEKKGKLFFWLYKTIKKRFHPFGSKTEKNGADIFEVTDVERRPRSNFLDHFHYSQAVTFWVMALNRPFIVFFLCVHYRLIFWFVDFLSPFYENKGSQNAFKRLGNHDRSLANWRPPCYMHVTHGRPFRIFFLVRVAGIMSEAVFRKFDITLPP